jgi:hypothetical protein
MSVAGKRLSFFLVELKSHKTIVLLFFTSLQTVALHCAFIRFDI